MSAPVPCPFMIVVLSLTVLIVCLVTEQALPRQVQWYHCRGVACECRIDRRAKDKWQMMYRLCPNAVDRQLSSIECFEHGGRVYSTHAFKTRVQAVNYTTDLLHTNKTMSMTVATPLRDTMDCTIALASFSAAIALIFMARSNGRHDMSKPLLKH